jgi:hypothetical protein
MLAIETYRLAPVQVWIGKMSLTDSAKFSLHPAPSHPSLATPVCRGRKQRVDQRPQPAEICESEVSSARSDTDERIYGRQARPRNGEPQGLLFPRSNVNPIVGPILTTLNQLKLVATKRVERMRDPDALNATLGSACS